MNPEEVTKAIESGVQAGIKAALEDKLKPFYVERETHYKQHEFIGAMMEYTKTCKSVIMKTIITIFVAGALGLFYIGFIVRHGGKP